MKKYTIYVFLLTIVSGFFFFCAGSCSNGLDYYVKFTANGEEVVFGLGLTDVEENAFANVVNSDGSNTVFVATPATVDSGMTPSSSIVIDILGTETRTYTSNSGELSIYFMDSGMPYHLISGTVNVTSFGEVGSTIEGRFEATLYKYDAGANSLKEVKSALPVDITITDGLFKVKRIADDSYIPILALY
jgi:hypothetical protein